MFWQRALAMSGLYPMVAVKFYDDVLEVVKDENGNGWVCLKRICENLGINIQSQAEKLAKSRRPVTTMIVTTAPDGKKYSTLMIAYRSVFRWLDSINSKKVKPEARPKLERYQEEVEEVLANYFIGKMSHSETQGGHDVMTETLKACLGMRQNQLALECKLGDLETQHHELAVSIRGNLSELHHRMDGIREVTESAIREARHTANTALATAERNHGWFSVLAFYRRKGVELTIGEAGCHGRQISATCKIRGIQPQQIADPRFGSVNTYPESMLEEYYTGIPCPLPVLSMQPGVAVQDKPVSVPANVAPPLPANLPPKQVKMNAAKRLRLRAALKKDPYLSDTLIAAQALCSATLVFRVRLEMELHKEIPTVTIKRGRDGKARRVMYAKACAEILNSDA